jgi:hypothetical protein
VKAIMRQRKWRVVLERKNFAPSWFVRDEAGQWCGQGKTPVGAVANALRRVKESEEKNVPTNQS